MTVAVSKFDQANLTMGGMSATSTLSDVRRLLRVDLSGARTFPPGRRFTSRPKVIRRWPCTMQSTPLRACRSFRPLTRRNLCRRWMHVVQPSDTFSHREHAFRIVIRLRCRSRAETGRAFFKVSFVARSRRRRLAYRRSVRRHTSAGRRSDVRRSPCQSDASEFSWIHAHG